MTPEGVLKKEIADFLAQSGLLHFRMQSGVIRKGSRFIHLCPEGTADYLVFKGRLPYWLELKAPQGTTTAKRKAAQAAFRDEVEAQGHEYRIVTNLQDAVEAVGG